ncbi:MAG: hypothetical protein LBQ66_08175, partial [Planctomycetaceae bacterium]|nr:hypothetical protein [Planctomycetaceae bacterium]
MTKKTKTLVVDTSVARAVRKDGTFDLIAVRCRQLLDVILSNDYQIAMSREIESEWKKWRGFHSTFASKWLVEMAKRDRVHDVGDVVDDNLRNAILATTKNPSIRTAMQKDFLLLEAALATDKTILSRDKKSRKYFRQAAVLIDKIREIIWANPDEQEDKIIIWLKNGAPI